MGGIISFEHKGKSKFSDFKVFVDNLAIIIVDYHYSDGKWRCFIMIKSGMIIISEYLMKTLAIFLN